MKSDMREPCSAASPFSRRLFLQAGVATLAVCGVLEGRAEFPAQAYAERLSALEVRHGGRLGVAYLPLDAGAPAGHRLDERFGMCSTFKLALAAFILQEIQQGRLGLDTRVQYTADDIVPYSPVTLESLPRAYMTVAELAQAAQIKSDNTAANLLLALIDGPGGFTRRLRKIGDETTRLDRLEPELNFVPEGEVRDTTTPAAMAATVRHLVLGSFLSDENKMRLQAWMEATRTGRGRLRAGFPAAWRSGDKTGTGVANSMASKYNDVAVAWPADGLRPFVLTAYYDSGDAFNEFSRENEVVLRSVGEITASFLSADA